MESLVKVGKHQACQIQENMSQLNDRPSQLNWLFLRFAKQMN